MRDACGFWDRGYSSHDGLPQIQQELTKLLELKAKLEDEAPASGKFVLKCPKVRSLFCGDSVFHSGRLFPPPSPGHT